MIYVDNKIDNTAKISKKAVIGTGNIIGAYTIIGDNVLIGNDNKISSHVVIGSPGEVKDNNEQIDGEVHIGNANVIREFTRIHSPVRTILTRIKDDNYIGSNSHIGHDAKVGSHVVMVTGSVLGGWVIIEDYVNIAIGAKIHPRLSIGEGAMLGMGTIITKHIKPFDTIIGIPCRILGRNDRGIKKTGISEEDIYMKIQMFIKSYEVLTKKA
ncbi:MAG: hypothetical protein ACUZ8H_13730 [Candidatus Anammoxibacter sp.]